MSLVFLAGGAGMYQGAETADWPIIGTAPLFTQILAVGVCCIMVTLALVAIKTLLSPQTFVAVTPRGIFSSTTHPPLSVPWHIIKEVAPFGSGNQRILGISVHNPERVAFLQPFLKRMKSNRSFADWDWGFGVRAFEADPALVETALQYYHFYPDQRLEIGTTEGLAAMQERARQGWQPPERAGDEVPLIDDQYPDDDLYSEDQDETQWDDTKESLHVRFITWLQRRENQTPYYVAEWLFIKLYRRRIQATLDALDQSIMENKRRRGIPDTIDQYREKFKRAPLGRWNSSFDFGPWPTDAWEFYSDGTGKIFQYGGPYDNTVLFEWQAEAERLIRFRVVDRGTFPEDDEDEAEEGCDEPAGSGEEEAMDWTTIAYDFKIIEHYGPIVVMYQVPEGETCKFWLTADYLQFEGDLDTEAPRAHTADQPG